MARKDIWARPELPCADAPSALAVCGWCGDVIRLGEPAGFSDGERMHLHCAAEDMDNASFDRDFGG